MELVYDLAGYKYAWAVLVIWSKFNITFSMLVGCSAVDINAVKFLQKWEHKRIKKLCPEKIDRSIENNSYKNINEI